jgi:hypothetical protein
LFKEDFMATANQPETGGGQSMRVNVEVPADLDAIYANFAMIQHSPSEFIVDFARLLPNNPKAKVYARIILTPMSAKLLLRALAENIENFEKQYGEVKTGDTDFTPHQSQMGFVKK